MSAAKDQAWVTEVDPKLKSGRDEPLQVLHSKPKAGSA